ncbi:hypothetical protein PAPYR_2711 [Paratrimastix pyriformis]|uniref:Uncharacterized protein n=1 Tax=Paratrimastix pyriformis TaxID=342808 RepID=A0ABQ8US11_9EUKA|nr:hypothetical protein PAPYR_2711 [Paratrimastix pyriformis]
MLGFAGAHVRQVDMFSNKSFLSRTKGMLKKTFAKFPFQFGAARERPTEVVVFVIGGLTYAEMRAMDRVVEQVAGTGATLDVSGKPIEFSPTARLAGVTSGVGADGTLCYLGGTSVLDEASFRAEVEQASSVFQANSPLFRPPQIPVGAPTWPLQAPVDIFRIRGPRRPFKGAPFARIW